MHVVRFLSITDHSVTILTVGMLAADFLVLFVTVSLSFTSK